MDHDDVFRMIESLRKHLPQFPTHDKDGCDCELCLAHDSILTAESALRRLPLPFAVSKQNL